MTFRAAGVILAGGLSRRMGGGDKGLRRLAGRPMLSHVIDRLRPQVDMLALNANGDPDRFSDLALPVLPDPVGGHIGPLCGVLAGMNWAASEHPGVTHIVTAASDTPFFPEDLVERLIGTAQGNEHCVVLAGSGGHRHPVFGLWPVDLRADLSDWIASTDTFKVIVWVQRHENRIAEFPLLEGPRGPLDPFFNINTAQDLEVAEEVMPEFSA